MRPAKVSPMQVSTGRPAQSAGLAVAPALKGSVSRNRSARRWRLRCSASGRRWAKNRRSGAVSYTHLVYVAAAADGDVVGQQLQRNNLDERAQQLHRRRDVDHVLHHVAYRGVALGGNGDHAARACGDLLNVGDGLLVAQTGRWIALVSRGENNDGKRLVDERIGAVLHLAGGVALGMNVGDFLELERAFERNGEVNSTPEVEEVAGVGKVFCQLFALCGARAQDFFDLARNAAKLLDEGDRLRSIEMTAKLAKLEREDKQRGELGGEGLCGGDADLRAGVGCLLYTSRCV